MKTLVIWITRDYNQLCLLCLRKTCKGRGPIGSDLVFLKKNQMELVEMESTVNKMKDFDGMC